MATPGWFDMFAKLTSPKKRGRLVGIRNSLGGLGAFIGGFILTWLLATFAFPVNYAVGFFIAFVLQISSIVIQGRLIEKDPHEQEMLHWLEQAADTDGWGVLEE